MKKLITFFTVIVLTGSLLYAQKKKDDEVIKITAPGTGAKPKIIPSLTSLAVAQVKVSYKLSSTTRTVTQEKKIGGGGHVAGAKVRCFLETTDGELTEDDFQSITDNFYSYFSNKLKENNINPVDWSAITATDFYQSGAEKPTNDKNQKPDNVSISNTANKGNVLYGGSFAFAFGKQKKASAFCKEVNAPAGFFNLTVDFADVLVDLDIKSTEYQDLGNGWYRPATEKKKYSWAVEPDIKVMASDANSFTLFWNEKTQSETMTVAKDISGDKSYGDKITEDPGAVTRPAFGFYKDLAPVTIETTKAKYITAAEKALDNFADEFVAEVLKMHKG